MEGEGSDLPTAFGVTLITGGYGFAFGTARRHEDTKNTKESVMFNQSSRLSESEEQIVTQVLDVGYTVHRHLGPGFREVIYQRAYCLELDSRRIPFESERQIQVRFKDGASQVRRST
jgi:hypothetical protein